MGRSLSRKHGPTFTMVELIVVMAILMILAGLLMPVLTKARQKAQIAQCLGQLQRIGRASFLYSDDWDGHFPCFCEGARRGSWVYLGKPVPSASGPKFWYQTLSPYLGSTQGLHCPTSGFRYAINSSMTTNPPPCSSGIAIATIQNPAEKFLFGDSFQYPFPDGSSMKDTVLCLRFFRGDVYQEKGVPVTSACLGGALGIAHDGATTMLYCDGHVDSFRPDDSTWGTMAAYKNHWLPHPNTW